MNRLYIIAFCLGLSACAGSSAEPVKSAAAPAQNEVTYINDFNRIVDNVIIKEKTPKYIAYEYKDVRVDEVGMLANRYCRELDYNRKAVLRDIILNKNYKRIATFDCLDKDAI